MRRRQIAKAAPPGAAGNVTVSAPFLHRASKLRMWASHEGTKSTNGQKAERRGMKARWGDIEHPTLNVELRRSGRAE